MKYFELFPTIDFNGLKVKDLTRRAQFIRSIKDNAVLVGDYRVKDGETPWSLAYDFYGDSSLYWLLLHLNDIVDPFFDWCLTQPELVRYVDNLYGSAKYDTRYWVLDDRIYTQDPANPLAVEVTNADHEDILNENRRAIRILRPEYLSKAIRSHEKAMTGRREGGRVVSV